MRRILSRLFRSRVTLTSNLSMQVSRFLEQDFLTLATAAADESKIQHDRGDHADELRSAIQAIVFSALAVEASINRHALMRYGQEFSAWTQLPTTHPTVQNKIKFVFDGNDGYAKADLGRAPLQQFRDLKKLRDYLVHYTTVFIDPIKTGHFSMTEPASKLHCESANESSSSASSILRWFAESVPSQD